MRIGTESMRAVCEIFAANEVLLLYLAVHATVCEGPQGAQTGVSLMEQSVIGKNNK